jgi:hypothetical protein
MSASPARIGAMSSGTARLVLVVGVEQDDDVRAVPHRLRVAGLLVAAVAAFSEWT